MVYFFGTDYDDDLICDICDHLLFMGKVCRNCKTSFCGICNSNKCPNKLCPSHGPGFCDDVDAEISHRVMKA